MRFLHSVFKSMDKIAPAKVAYAHCDIPCGIYDPHHAQMAAHTVIRMVNLINDLPEIKPDMSNEQKQEVMLKFHRYSEVKEKHAEIAKHEIRILWGDYFKPEHVEKFPDLHELVWAVMKLGSKVKQEVSIESSKDLLETILKISEIFWKTKGAEPIRAKSFYPTELDLVYPKV